MLSLQSFFLCSFSICFFEAFFISKYSFLFLILIRFFSQFQSIKNTQKYIRRALCNFILHFLFFFIWINSLLQKITDWQYYAQFFISELRLSRNHEMKTKKSRKYNKKEEIGYNNLFINLISIRWNLKKERENFDIETIQSLFSCSVIGFLRVSVFILFEKLWKYFWWFFIRKKNELNYLAFSMAFFLIDDLW